MTTRGWIAAVALAACQGSSDGGGAPAVASSDAGVIGDAPVASVDASLDEEPVAVRTSTVPAWQAVIDRDLYLARRGQQAVVSGVVGGDATYPPPPPPPAPPVAPGAPPAPPPPPPPAGPALRWLADDTEGDGSLAIRVQFADPPPAAGAHVAVAGAWTLDDQRRWYWRATAVSPLPGAPALTSTPGHAVDASEPPAGTRPVTRAKDGGTITFQVLVLPRREGEGWQVADELGDPIAAILLLPGERPAYGGHDLRQADERWVLRRGVTYWVKIGKVRARKPDEPPVIRAVGAPHRVP